MGRKLEVNQYFRSLHEKERCNSVRAPFFTVSVHLIEVQSFHRTDDGMQSKLAMVMMCDLYWLIVNLLLHMNLAANAQKCPQQNAQKYSR